MILSRKKILIVATVILLVLLMVGIVVSKSQTGSKNITVETVENKKSGISISNFDTYSSGISETDKKSILEALSLRLESDTAEGSIRTNSYSKSDANNAITIQFIIDFQVLKTSLKIYSVRGSDGFNPTYVMCPEKDEFIYDGDVCTEGVNDEK